MRVFRVHRMRDGRAPVVRGDESAAGTPVGDIPIDAVLSRLENPTGQPFTAKYTIVTKATGATSNATVAVDVDRRSITISNIRFLIEGSRTGTCNVESGRCSNSIDDGRVSDVQVTHQFYGEATARRLRAEAAQRIAATAPSAATIAGFAATCVSVPLPAGSPIYCVLENGLLARMDNGDVGIELTAFRDGVDDSISWPSAIDLAAIDLAEIDLAAIDLAEIDLAAIDLAVIDLARRRRRRCLTRSLPQVRPLRRPSACRPPVRRSGPARRSDRPRRGRRHRSPSSPRDSR